MTGARRAAIAIVVLGSLIAGAWFLSQPQVPGGQPALVTLDAASVATLRDAFNRDTAHVRIIVLPSPT